MKDYERDYPDFRKTPFHEHGDEVPSNHSTKPTMYEVIEARTLRRGFMVGGLAALATGLFGGAVTTRAALAQTTAVSGLLGFAPVPLSKDDTVVVPEGYRVQILAPRGTPLTGDMPAFVPGGNSSAEQGMQVGMHHDGMHYYAIDRSSTDGLLVMNHEYIEPRFLHAAKWAGQALDADMVVFAADGNAAATGASAAEDYRNEPNAFGWPVEFDPFDPASVPVKRTHLGRFAHEGIVFAPAVAGKPVVCYSGDDSRFEYIYKFVSAANYDHATASGALLDEGTLYVAKFNNDGAGEWLALAPGQNSLTPENGFADLADILVNTRAAADQAGATKMDRPEWGTVDPNSGEVYFTLTNNNRRDMTQIDAVNPRAENNFGQIVRWSYEGGDHALPTFAWNLFVIAGTPRNSLVFNGETLGDDSTFACPDGLWCDAQSRLWIQTDMGDIGPNQTGPLEPFGMNAMLAADPATGEIRRFLTGPWRQEITGVIATPDRTTMFVNVQHPGAQATREEFAGGTFGSGFPDYNGTVPRSATLVITRDDGGVIGA